MYWHEKQIKKKINEYKNEKKKYNFIQKQILQLLTNSAEELIRIRF